MEAVRCCRLKGHRTERTVIRRILDVIPDAYRVISAEIGRVDRINRTDGRSGKLVIIVASDVDYRYITGWHHCRGKRGRGTVAVIEGERFAVNITLVEINRRKQLVGVAVLVLDGETHLTQLILGNRSRSIYPRFRRRGHLYRQRNRGAGKAVSFAFCGDRRRVQMHCAAVVVRSNNIDTGKIDSINHPDPTGTRTSEEGCSLELERRIESGNPDRQGFRPIVVCRQGGCDGIGQSNTMRVGVDGILQQYRCRRSDGSRIGNAENPHGKWKWR